LRFVRLSQLEEEDEVQLQSPEIAPEIARAPELAEDADEAHDAGRSEAQGADDAAVKEEEVEGGAHEMQVDSMGDEPTEAASKAPATAPAPAPAPVARDHKLRLLQRASRAAAHEALALMCALAMSESSHGAIGGAAGVVSNIVFTCPSLFGIQACTGSMVFSLSLVGNSCATTGNFPISCSPTSDVSFNFAYATAVADCKPNTLYYGLARNSCEPYKAVASSGAGSIAVYALGIAAALFAAGFRLASAIKTPARAPAADAACAACATSPAASLVPSVLALVLFVVGVAMSASATGAFISVFTTFFIGLGYAIAPGSSIACGVIAIVSQLTAVILDLSTLCCCRAAAAAAALSAPPAVVVVSGVQAAYAPAHPYGAYTPAGYGHAAAPHVPVGKPPAPPLPPGWFQVQRRRGAPRACALGRGLDSPRSFPLQCGPDKNGDVWFEAPDGTTTWTRPT
jgi:hypothetical protein